MDTQSTPLTAGTAFNWAQCSSHCRALGILQMMKLRFQSVASPYSRRVAEHSAPGAAINKQELRSPDLRARTLSLQWG
jgi:hypothetical protein